MHFRTALRLTAACLILIAATAQAQQAKPNAIVVIDRIIAVVNDEVITERELAARVDFALRQLAQQGTQPPARQILEKQLLERTINDRVQMQYARDTGTRVDNAELDRAMLKIAEQNKMTVAELRTVLAKDNVPYDKFREDIRSEITLSRLREREVAQKIVVTESEIDNFIAYSDHGSRKGLARAAAGAS